MATKQPKKTVKGITGKGKGNTKSAGAKSSAKKVTSKMGNKPAFGSARTSAARGGYL